MIAVELDGITRTFGDRVVLDDISFRVEKGHIHGLLGPNGAGKTTTMRILANLLSPNHGSVKINGNIQDQKQAKPYKGLGFLLEEAPLYGEMRVEEYLKFVGGLKGLSKDEVSRNLDYCCEKLGLGPVIGRSIENLSQGFKKRVGIAQALIHRPEILILDEPTAGLDPKSVFEIRNLILELKQAHTVIISSHLLHEMSLVCDDLTIISEGKIRETGTLDDLRKRIEGRSEICIKIASRSEDFLNFLIEHEDILNVEVEVQEEDVAYRMQSSNPRKITPLLVEKAVDLNLSVVGVENSELSLEEIFMRIINK